MIQLLQAHSGTLYLVSLCFWWAGLVTCLIVASQIAFSSVRLIEESSILRWKDMTADQFVTRFRGRVRIVNRLAVVATLIMFIGCGTIFYSFTDRFQRTERITLKNVHVLSRHGENDFVMEVESRSHNGDWQPFAVTFCPTTHATPEIVPGVTLLALTYTEDQELKCFDARQPNGYILWRYNNDPHQPPILSDFRARSAAARPEETAASARSETAAEARAGR
jgi:hypothetical protein